MYKPRRRSARGRGVPLLPKLLDCLFQTGHIVVVRGGRVVHVDKKR